MDKPQFNFKLEIDDFLWMKAYCKENSLTRSQLFRNMLKNFRKVSEAISNDFPKLAP